MYQQPMGDLLASNYREWCLEKLTNLWSAHGNRVLVAIFSAWKDCNPKWRAKCLTNWLLKMGRGPDEGVAEGICVQTYLVNLPGRLNNNHYQIAAGWNWSVVLPGHCCAIKIHDHCNLDVLDVFGKFFWYGFWLLGTEFGFPVLNSRHLQIPEGSIYETNPKDHAPLTWSNQLWSPHTACFKFRAPYVMASEIIPM